MKLYAKAPTGATSRARGLRRSATDAERVLWHALRETLPAAKWRRQVPLGPYFVDFLSFSAKLIVEVDGGQHGEAEDYDARRTCFMEDQGYRVIRFWNNDVLGNLPGVLETIASALKPLSLRERGWGEGGASEENGSTASSSPSHAAHGPLPLPMGEGL